MNGTRLDHAKCKKAIKLLTRYEHLAPKFRVRLRPNRIQRLNALRDAGTITSSDLPGTIASEMPGEFIGMTLAEIREHCGMR